MRTVQGGSFASEQNIFELWGLSLSEAKSAAARGTVPLAGPLTAVDRHLQRIFTLPSPFPTHFQDAGKEGAIPRRVMSVANSSEAFQRRPPSSQRRLVGRPAGKQARPRPPASACFDLGRGGPGRPHARRSRLA